MTTFLLIFRMSLKNDLNDLNNIFLSINFCSSDTSNISRQNKSFDISFVSLLFLISWATFVVLLLLLLTILFVHTWILFLFLNGKNKIKLKLWTKTRRYYYP